MGSSTSKKGTTSQPQLQSSTVHTSTTKSPTEPKSLKETSIQPHINNNADKKRIDSQSLISAYSRSIINYKGKCLIPNDIINIIFMYFHLIFHFEVIPKIKKCGTKNIMDVIGDYGNEEEIPAVVVSIDCESIMVGFAGDDEPRIIVPNIISIGKEIVYGHDLNNPQFNLSTAIRPYEYAEIEDEDALKQILLQILNKNLDKKMHLLLTESVPFLYREEITTFAFEELNCDRFYLEPRSVLSLYASGRTTGIVVMSDYECTEIVAIFEGYTIKETCKKIKFGTRDVMDYLDMEQYDININTKSNAMSLFFDKANIHNEINDIILKSVQYIKNEKLENSYVSYGGSGTKRDFYGNIVLSGINTYYNGFADMLQSEMYKLTDAKIKIVCPPERNRSSWIGGSILCSLSTFEEMWITRKEYEEKGAEIVNTKCDARPET